MLSSVLLSAAMFAVEIRAYNLVPGTRDEFHRMVVEEAMPVLRQFEVDVVAYGPSLHDDDSYYVIRAYRDVPHRDASHADFYGSSEWQSGPRDSILALIASFTTVVIELDRETLQRLRRTPSEGNLQINSSD